MIVKIYALIWVLGIAAAGLFYLTGNLTPTMQVAFGFLTFGTVFMGMMSVLPATVTAAHQPAAKAATPMTEKRKEKTAARTKNINPVRPQSVPVH